MATRRRTWFLVRVAVYVAIIALLTLTRGGIDWRRIGRLLRAPADNEPTLIVAGQDLAPRLIHGLVEHYRRDYPDLTVTLTGGGTNRALEDLANGTADVAFLYRPPTAAEQELFRTATGDTAVVVSVAVGGVALLAGSTADTTDLTMAELRDILAGAPQNRCSRVYAPDPNDGLWDATLERLEGPVAPGAELPAGSPVAFLKDEAAVVAAVAADPESWGLISTLAVPDDDTGLPAVGLAALSLGSDPGTEPARPTFANLATGAYPLFHRLYAACRGSGGIQGGMFLTHLASARGLRRVERAGVVPARQILREIRLSRDPPGG